MTECEANASAPRRCAGCGAGAPRPDARFCEHCGAVLALVSALSPPPAHPLGDVEARWRALRAHPQLAQRLAAKPVVPELAGKTLPSVLGLALLALFGFFASLMMLQLCPPLGFLPLVLVGVGFLALTRQMLRGARAPLVARPALVLELRARLDAGARHSPAHTRHFATLQFEDGGRHEHECFPSALDGLRAGSMGVAHLTQGRLAAFTHLPA